MSRCTGPGRPPSASRNARAHELGDAPRVVHHRAPLGQRREYGAAVHVHEHAAVRVGRGAVLVGGDQQRGEVVVECHAGAGGQVEAAGPHLAERDRDAAGAGKHCGGHHRARCLVAQAHEADSRCLRQRVQQRRQLAAGDAEGTWHTCSARSSRTSACAPVSRMLSPRASLLGLESGGLDDRPPVRRCRPSRSPRTPRATGMRARSAVLGERLLQLGRLQAFAHLPFSALHHLASASWPARTSRATLAARCRGSPARRASAPRA